ncbi:transposase [Aeromonas salmonicida]|uniref:transposase n=1 Tax=Aeromonas salmonicida TaxID=645 RepID=UPI003BF81BC9
MGKALHPITNWPQYNRSLINRGSLTFWVDAEAMDNWFHQDHHGKRGRSQLYTDQSICTVNQHRKMTRDQRPKLTRASWLISSSV